MPNTYSKSEMKRIATTNPAMAAQELERLKKEIERLHRVIAKELSENDELGCEYTYVNVLRQENEALKELVQRAEFYVKFYDNEVDACGSADSWLESARKAVGDE